MLCIIGYYLLGVVISMAFIHIDNKFFTEKMEDKTSLLYAVGVSLASWFIIILEAIYLVEVIIKYSKKIDLAKYEWYNRINSWYLGSITSTKD